MNKRDTGITLTNMVIRSALMVLLVALFSYSMWVKSRMFVITNFYPIPKLEAAELYEGTLHFEPVVVKGVNRAINYVLTKDGRRDFRWSVRGFSDYSTGLIPVDLASGTSVRIWFEKDWGVLQAEMGISPKGYDLNKHSFSYSTALIILQEKVIFGPGGRYSSLGNGRFELAVNGVLVFLAWAALAIDIFRMSKRIGLNNKKSSEQTGVGL